MPRAIMRRQDAPLVQLSGDRDLDSGATRPVVLISRLQQHHPVAIVQLAVPVEKRAYLQR
jgi:mRNA-degrading endonuclease toxin of MazEF toxin-antitoxin module